MCSSASQTRQAKGEPDWSDIDADGRAFHYSPAEWTAVILAFAETGKLSHPRYERGEKGLPEVPDMPTAYVPSMPFIKARQKPAPDRPASIPAPDDVGQYDAAITGQDLDDLPEAPPAPQAKPRPRRAPKSPK